MMKNLQKQINELQHVFIKSQRENSKLMSRLEQEEYSEAESSFHTIPHEGDVYHVLPTHNNMKEL